MAMSAEDRTIQEITHLVSTRMDLQTEQIKELSALQDAGLKKIDATLEQLETERKEFRAARELLDDLVAEYDRLTERQSTQLRAMIEWFEQLKRQQ